MEQPEPDISSSEPDIVVSSPDPELMVSSPGSLPWGSGEEMEVEPPVNPQKEAEEGTFISFFCTLDSVCDLVFILDVMCAFVSALVDKEKLALLSKFIPKIRNPTVAAAVASRSSKRKKTLPVRYTPEEMRRKVHGLNVYMIHFMLVDVYTKVFFVLTMIQFVTDSVQKQKVTKVSPFSSTLQVEAEVHSDAEGHKQAQPQPSTSQKLDQADKGQEESGLDSGEELLKDFQN